VWCIIGGSAVPLAADGIFARVEMIVACAWAMNAYRLPDEQPILDPGRVAWDYPGSEGELGEALAIPNEPYGVTLWNHLFRSCWKWKTMEHSLGFDDYKSTVSMESSSKGGRNI
jgi:hypothetical protein